MRSIDVSGRCACAELGHHTRFVPAQKLAETVRKRAQLVGVFQNARFVLQLRILARRKTRVLDLFRDVSQIVRALLGFGSTRR